MNYNGTQTIRISKANYDLLMAYKEKTGISVTAFANKAISEKIKRIKSKKKV
jgi:hypothetical protein